MENHSSTQEPKNLSPLGKVAYDQIMAMVNHHGLQTEGCFFHNPKEWRARGEVYGSRSELVIVYDGGEVGEVCRTDGVLYEEMRKVLQSHRLYIEECTGWYAAVYRC